MTSSESMLFKRVVASVVLVVGLCLTNVGCGGSSLTPPDTLVSPYDSAYGEALWAVAPLVNESGTTILELDALTDALVRSCQQIEGVRCLPLNRVLSEMRGLGMSSTVRTPDEAAALASRLGVNGLIVGTVTDYDPYNPPKLGMSLVLQSGAALSRQAGLNLDGLRGGATTSETGSTARYTELPNASISIVFDGRNHATLMEMRRYASGRHDPGTASGWRTYLTSMPLFSEFAAHAAVGRLLDEERLRLARQRASQQVSSR